jgi:cytochrome P450
LTDPKSLAEVLVTKSYDFEKPSEIRNFLRLVLGDGLVIVEGEEHKFQRKHLLPAFSYRHIKDLYPIFWSKASILNGLVAAEMYENPEPSSDSSNSKRLQGVVEINHWVNKVTMDIIGVAGLSREFNALHNSNDELIENYEALLEPSVEKAIFFAVNLIMPRKLVQMLPWKMNEKLETTTQNLRRICRQLVRDKKALKDSEKDGQVDILKLLIKSNDFSDDQLVDQLLTFLAAG